MAEIHAIQNGNWSDGSTWNSGTVPTADDDVELNGFVITLSQNQEISAKVITNSQGGYFNNNNGGNGVIINAKVIAVNGYLFYNNKFTINGDVESYNSGHLDRWWNSGQGSLFTINGNLHIRSDQSIGPFAGMPYYYGNCYINGNVISDAPIAVFCCSTGVYSLIINGDVYINKGYLYQSSNFAGQIIFNGDCVCETRLSSAEGGNNNWINNTIVFNGNFVYNFYGNPIPCRRMSFGETSIIRNNDISGFTIINPQQVEYANPNENVVAKGVIYGIQRQLIGKMELPQESTVLKDVEYGDNQVGTLEVIALSGATATAENISVVNLTEQEVERVKNCATVSTVQKCFEDFKEE